MRTGGFCQWFQSDSFFLLVFIIVLAGKVCFVTAGGGELLNALCSMLFSNAYILAMQCGRCRKMVPWKAGIDAAKM